MSKGNHILANLVERAKLRTSYPQAAQDEVKRWLQAPHIHASSLSDLTALPFVTIDHRSSMDLDQAVHIERRQRGYFVRYALADAAFYVPAGSALFEEALARGASFYLPGLCVPMLPRPLSEGLVSLNPDVDRRALVFEMALDESGDCVETRLVRARIRSRAKLSFHTVQSFYDHAETSTVTDEAFAESLSLLKEVGLLRIAEARARDVIPFDRDELRVSIQGAKVTVSPAPRLRVEEYNAQISLLCNMEGAKLLGHPNERAQPIYRVHPPPAPRRIDHLEDRLGHLVASHGLPETWRWRRAEETLADYLERLPRSKDTARLRLAIQRQVVLIFERSLFRAEPGRHYALAVDGYSRFSSPMREIAGIFTHKEALELLDPNLSAPPAEEDNRLRKAVVAAANRAKEIQRRLERAIHKVALDAILNDDMKSPESERPDRTGTILGVRPSRLYVRLDSPPIEVKVYASDLATKLGCAVEIDPEQTQLVAGPAGPSFRIGDAIRLRTGGHDDRRNRWQLYAVD